MGASYYLYLDEKQLGPLTAEQVRSLWKGGDIKDSTLIWREGEEGWRLLLTMLSELKSDGDSIDLPRASLLPTSTLPLPPILVRNNGAQNLSRSGIVVVLGCLTGLVYFFGVLSSCSVTPQTSSPPPPSAGGTAACPLQPDLVRPPFPADSRYFALQQKNGFREYHLGESITRFNPSDLGTPFVNGDVNRYMLNNFDRKLGACEISNIYLEFQQGYLTGITVYVEGEENSEALKDALIAAYGEPEHEPIFTSSCIWSGDDVVLELETIGTGSQASFESRSVDASVKEITDRKAKDSAASAAHNL